MRRPQELSVRQGTAFWAGGTACAERGRDKARELQTVWCVSET